MGKGSITKTFVDLEQHAYIHHHACHNDYRLYCR